MSSRLRNNNEFPASVPENRPEPGLHHFSGGLLLELAALVLILAAFAGLGAGARRQNSVTVDEFAHLPAGISYLRTGDFRLYPQSPPLLRMIEALPAALDRKTNLPLAQGWVHENIWEVSWDFMYANRARL